MRVLLQKIYDLKDQRPYGYVEECLANGKIDGDYIEFTDSIYWQLRDKYSKPRGLGDSITKVMQATGISQIVNRVTMGGCNCGKRQDKLNELVPYKT